MDYSLNAVNLPVVGYGGEIDPQLRGSTNIREQLTREGFHFQHEGLNWFGTDLQSIFLVGPQTAHKFHPDSKQTSDEFINKAVAKGREEHPGHIRQVGVERPAERDVHDLHASTDAEGRHPHRDRRAEQPDLQLVAIGLDAVEVVVVGLAAVPGRIDVAAADEQEPVEGLEELLRLAGLAGRDDRGPGPRAA